MRHCNPVFYLFYSEHYLVEIFAGDVRGVLEDWTRREQAARERARDYAAPADARIDVDDFAGALQRDVSKRWFHVVEDELELRDMLQAPLETWRVFLHPSQRCLVERTLFHVAAARAVQRLYLSAHGEPSPFLTAVAGQAKGVP